MVGTAMAIGAGVGGLLNYLTGREANKAGLEANRLDIEARKEDREAGFNAFQLDSPLNITTRTPEGGFKVSQPGDTDAASAQGIRAFGDIDRAVKSNIATRDFEFKVPSMKHARNIVTGDRNLKQSSIITPGLEMIQKAKKRQLGGMGNTGETANTFDAIKQFYDSQQIGGEQAALNLFNKSGEADTALLTQLLDVMQAQQPGPGIVGGGPGASAANLVAQTPAARNTPDLGGAVGPQAAGSVVSNIMQQMALEDSRKAQGTMIRQLKDAGFFGVKDK